MYLLSIIWLLIHLSTCAVLPTSRPEDHGQHRSSMVRNQSKDAASSLHTQTHILLWKRTPNAPAISQISDGQVQAPTYTSWNAIDMPISKVSGTSTTASSNSNSLILLSTIVSETTLVPNGSKSSGTSTESASIALSVSGSSKSSIGTVPVSGSSKTSSATVLVPSTTKLSTHTSKTLSATAPVSSSSSKTSVASQQPLTTSKASVISPEGSNTSPKTSVGSPQVSGTSKASTTATPVSDTSKASVVSPPVLSASLEASSVSKVTIMDIFGDIVVGFPTKALTVFGSTFTDLVSVTTISTGTLPRTSTVGSSAKTSSSSVKVSSTATSAAKASSNSGSSSTSKASSLTSKASSSTSKISASTPVPSDDMVVSVTSAAKTFLQTFVPTTYSQYTTVKGTIVETTVIAGTSIPIIIGPGGVGWEMPSISSGEPRAVVPLSLPLVSAPDSIATKASTASSSPNVAKVTGATVIRVTSGTNTFLETFFRTIYPQFTTLKSATITTFTVMQGSTLPVIIGPGGVAWQFPSLVVGEPRASAPTILPVIEGVTTSSKSVSSTRSSSESSSTVKSSTGQSKSTGKTSSSSKIGSSSSSSIKLSSSSSSSKTCQTTCASSCPVSLLCTSTLKSITTSSVKTISGVSHNTEISTHIGGSGGGSGTDDTCIPFLWGCVFCNLIGMLLGGVPCVPGVYYPPVPPPFPNFPPITMGFDHIPTVGPITGPTNQPTGSSSLSSSKSSSGCSTKTVSDCEVQCTASPSVVSGKTTYSSACKTTCSKTIGCSAAPTTITSKTTESVSTVDVITVTDLETGIPISENYINMQFIIAGDAYLTSSMGVSFPIPTFSSLITSLFPVSKAPSTSSKASTTTSKPSSLECSNPSLEDSDGLCTCWIGTSTIGTYTPSGGPGNSCPATVVYTSFSKTLTSVIPSKSATSSSSASKTSTFGCSNPSLEDGDGLCTCHIGTSTVGTFTPSGGPGNSCPTIMPTSAKTSSASKTSSLPTVETTSHSGNISCNVAIPSIQQFQFKFFNRDSAIKAISVYCEALRAQSIIIDSKTPIPPDTSDSTPVIGDISEGTAYLTLNVSWTLAGCANVKKPAELNFLTLSSADCENNFKAGIDGCPNFSRPPLPSSTKTNSAGVTPSAVLAYDYWKIGGTFYKDCAYWGVAARP